jgi:multicomponent Na+:H+ antiporter subunit D
MVKIFAVFPKEIFEAVPVQEIVLLLSAMAVMAGSVFAMLQDDIKRMLACSSVAQIGFVFMGIGFFEGQALIGGLLHIFNHAVVKAMLFLAAGLIIYATGIRRISQFRGLGTRLSLTMAAFVVGSLAMVGIPGTSGFISKWYLAMGALEVDRPFYIVIILLSSLLNGIYYFPIIITAFFGGIHQDNYQPGTEWRELPRSMLVPVLLLAAATIFFGFYPGPLLELLQEAVKGF